MVHLLNRTEIYFGILLGNSGDTYNGLVLQFHSLSLLIYFYRVSDGLEDYI